MSTDYRRILDFLRDTFKGAELPPATRLSAREYPPSPRVPGGSSLTEEAIAERWELPAMQGAARETLADPWAMAHREAEAGLFVAWAASAMDAFKAVARETTRYRELVNLQLTVEGNHVYLGLQFTTGDASGQNMVTIIGALTAGHFTRAHQKLARGTAE